MDYGRGGGVTPGSTTAKAVVTGVGTGVGATTLPVTGSNWAVSVALALAVMLVLWGVFYAIQNRTN